MENWRLALLIIIMTLSVIDLLLTFIYVNEYKKWQPNKPFNQIEMNPLLTFLWNNLGLIIGSIVGFIIILTLNFIIVKNTYWIFPVILLGLLLFTLFNHVKNFGLLSSLIQQYPTGYLPVKIFGNVSGNNII